MAPLDERGAAQLDLLVKVQRATLSDVVRSDDVPSDPNSLKPQGFKRQSFLLFKILSSVKNHQINSDLARLLLRLDYNKYYTQAGGTLGR